MKKIILVTLFLLTSCSSTRTVSINSETLLDEHKKVDWAITHQDSIIDFRRGGNRYAEIKGNQLFYMDGQDSIKKYELSKIRTVHIIDEVSIIPTLIFFSVVLTYSYFAILFSGMSM